MWRASIPGRWAFGRPPATSFTKVWHVITEIDESSKGNLSNLPLHGVRVVDLSWIIAGPTATRFLAMMGAEVIKVGSARRPDPSTRGAPFQAYNQGKLYASLNISKPEGLALALELVLCPCYLTAWCGSG